MAQAPATTLDHLVSAYLDDLQVRGHKAKTIHGYTKNLHTFARWAESQQVTTLAHLDADLVKQYIRYLQHKPKWAERGYQTTTVREAVAPSAIRNYVRDLKAFAAWLTAEHDTEGSVLDEVRVPKADETPIEPFGDEDLDRIFGALDTTDAFDLRDYVVLHTLWDTGRWVGIWWRSPSTTWISAPARSASSTPSSASGATSASAARPANT